MFEETMSRVLKRKGVWALLSLLLLLQAAAMRWYSLAKTPSGGRSRLG